MRRYKWRSTVDHRQVQRQCVRALQPFDSSGRAGLLTTTEDRSVWCEAEVGGRGSEREFSARAFKHNTSM